jgi:hypothetical protein
MMAFIEDQAGVGGGSIFAGAGGLHHGQRMIGDDDIGMGGGAGAMFDEAFAEMRTGGINALAAPIGERRRAIAAKQSGQPARQIAANHVTIARVCRPARHQLGQRGSAAREAALQRIF